MISLQFVRTMARYNRWQNRSLYTAADMLSPEERRKDRGAFFASIEGTLNHLLWGDGVWMHRFAGTPKPVGGIADSTKRLPEWDMLKRERVAVDEAIVIWSDGLSEEWLAGDMSWYSGAAGREVSKPNWFLVSHLFNHQTHHRGQVHAMLTAAGAKPDDTDLFLLKDMPPAD
ncbi:MAG: damage-inducible protein DinB [Rhizobiales bacterium PAR1]|nr:MAG: damage-inducible protein DinB [Rhizobiales bacterium PAR1]